MPPIAKTPVSSAEESSFSGWDQALEFLEPVHHDIDFPRSFRGDIHQHQESAVRADVPKGGPRCSKEDCSLSGFERWPCFHWNCHHGVTATVEQLSVIS